MFPFKKLHLKHHRIEQKLLLTYPALILISILVISISAIYFSKQSHKERSLAYANSMMSQISRNIDNQLSRVDQDSYIFYHNPDVKTFLLTDTDVGGQQYNQLVKRLQEFMVNFLLTHSDIESIYLISPHNRVISTVDSLKLQNLERYRMMADIGDGKIVWMDRETTHTGNQVIPLVRNLNDLATMKTNGVLLLQYRVSALNVDHDIGISGKMAVLSQTGEVITSDAEMSPELLANLHARISGGDRPPFMEDRQGDSIYVYHQSEMTNWTYVYSIPEAELYKGIDRVRNLVIAVAIVFSALAIISARLIAYNISQPIHRVIREMKNIEQNGLLVNIQVDGSDELYHLANSFNHMMNRLRQMMQKESELQRMQHELEMRALQAEINPHFLYNTLEAINWTGRIHRVPEICDMTSMLADIMRYSISYRRDLVTLEKEFEHVRKYIGIQQMRYKDKLSVFFDMPESLLDTTIPKLTLQPIVENAIVHGVEKKAGTGKVRIVGCQEGQTAVIRIEDNGPGIPEDEIRLLLDPESSPTKTGVGIRNVNKRLKLFFGEHYGIRMESVPGKGTRVIIVLPCIREGKIHEL